jgi:hypothetical protein
MRFAPVCVATLTLLAIAPSTAYAIEPAWVGARAGTLGLGAEVGVRIVPTIVVRGIGQGGSFDYDNTIDGIAYSGSLNLGSFGAQVDFRPPLFPGYITAGLFANQNDIDLSARGTGTITVGNTTYNAADVGTLTGAATFDSQALYGGLGVEFSIGPIAAVLEGGVFFQGEPEVAFTASGPLATNPAFAADLARETAQVADKLDGLAYWPAITLQARWKF